MFYFYIVLIWLAVYLVWQFAMRGLKIVVRRWIVRKEKEWIVELQQSLSILQAQALQESRERLRIYHERMVRHLRNDQIDWVWDEYGHPIPLYKFKQEEARVDWRQEGF